MAKVPYRREIDRAKGDILTGHVDAGIERWVGVTNQLIEAGEGDNARLRLEDLTAFLESNNRVSKSAGIFDTLAGLYTEMGMPANANASKSKAFGIREIEATTKGLDHLVAFYVSTDCEDRLLKLLRKDETIEMEKRAVEQRKRGGKKLFGMMWGVYDSSACYLSERKPGVAGQMRWTMGQMAERVADYKTALNSYERAIDLFKKDEETRSSLWNYKINAGMVAIAAGDRRKAKTLLIEGFNNYKRQEFEKSEGPRRERNRTAKAQTDRYFLKMSDTFIDDKRLIRRPELYNDVILTVYKAVASQNNVPKTLATSR